MNYIEIAWAVYVIVCVIVIINHNRKSYEIKNSFEDLKRRVDTQRMYNRSDRSDILNFKKEMESSLASVRKKVNYCLNKFHNDNSDKFVYLLFQEDDRYNPSLTIKGVHETYESAKIHLKEWALHENCFVVETNETWSATSKHTHLWITQIKLLSLL